MRRVGLPALVVPAERIEGVRRPIQVELYVRDRRGRRVAGLTATTTSVTVDAASVEEAYALAMPLLVAKVNYKMTGRMVWPEPEELPTDTAQTPLPPLVPRMRKEGRPRKVHDAGPWEQLSMPWDDIVSDD